MCYIIERMRNFFEGSAKNIGLNRFKISEYCSMAGKIQKVFTGFLFILLLAIFIFSLSLAWPVFKRYNAIQEEFRRTQLELDRKISESVALNREVHDLEHNTAAIEKVAREKYKLCKEGELILKYEN